MKCPLIKSSKGRLEETYISMFLVLKFLGNTSGLRYSLQKATHVCLFFFQKLHNKSKKDKKCCFFQNKKLLSELTKSPIKNPNDTSVNMS